MSSSSEFENHTENLPLINTPFEINLDARLSSMSIAVHFVEQYT
ncbi:5107_t:CDS:2 [Racocetra fulgida]|uniref:5107_t:CDS:1 n=1 Tax=Racocetra fulgida TaxID=60492 RepID=A0A9N8VMB3_9GLOM|nr:5107_t:CDS:2 [Racocetra fulgida]